MQYCIYLECNPIQKNKVVCDKHVLQQQGCTKDACDNLVVIQEYPPVNCYKVVTRLQEVHKVVKTCNRICATTN